MSRASQKNYGTTSNDWQTPDDFILILLEAFDRWLFDIDVCCTQFNVASKLYLTEAGTFDREENKLSDLDGLRYEWEGLCWMNPPYGKDLEKFISKAYHSALGGEASVIGLIPQRFENGYYHQYVLQSSGIYFFRGKKFLFTLGGQTGQNAYANAPQPLCLVFWNFSEQKLKEIEAALNKTRYTGIMARCHAL